MGFFSQDCTDCGHPLLSYRAPIQINRWMTEGVAIAPNGDIQTGSYDGYGHLQDIVDEEATVWHLACWTVAGKPLDYRGPSQPSADQGWFFDDADHAMPEPVP